MRPTQTTTAKLPRVCQGDIIRDVRYVESFAQKGAEFELSRIVFPLAVVLTQDCDLEQDFKGREKIQQGSQGAPKTQDKQLLSVLMAPLYNAEHVFAGSHLERLGIKMQEIPKTRTAGTDLMKNLRPRYHFLSFSPNIPIVESVIDFKHYFAVNLEYIRIQKVERFVCSLGPLFREDVAQRFASFLARIGLPEALPVLA